MRKSPYYLYASTITCYVGEMRSLTLTDITRRLMMATTADVPMRETTFPWWLVLLEGIFAAIFGILLLIAPGATLVFLVQVLGFYLLIESILRLGSMFLDSALWG